jgi:selenocysteine lyase/cysteine desulfurase
MFASDEIRKAFPHLAHCVYLNTASAGLSWSGQGTAAAKFYDGSKATGIGGQAEWTARTEEARAEVGRILGVPAARVGFAGSTTEALNLIALAMPLKAGDRVVVADDEFPSVVEPWMTLRSRGLALHRVQISSEVQRTKALCDAIDGRTRTLAVSHVHWRTGTRVDLDALAATCRKHDCRLIVDGVQAVGAVPVDASMADAYCASVFKWLLSGFGLSVIVLGEDFAGTLTPAVRGYSNTPPSRGLRYGHLNYPGIYALHATLKFLDSLGWKTVHERVAHLVVRSMRALRAAGFDVVTPESSHAGIVSIRHPRSGALVDSLARSSILVEDGSPYVRVSPHFYNTDEDIDRFLSALVLKG